jgi:hypothetical protein
MRTMWLPALWLAAQIASSQSLEVYSEFRRVDPFGAIVSSDRAGTPREILSPMVARNAHAGYFLVAIPPPGEWATLHVGQNPENAFVVRLYKVGFVRSGDEWTPQRLTEVKLPFQGILPEQAEVPGQKAFVFWLDIYVAPEAPVRRVKLEPQLHLHAQNRWIIYPMEVRVVAWIVPPVAGKPLDLLAPGGRADSGSMARLRSLVCGGGVAGNAARPDTLSYFVDRLALQDMALAQTLREGDKVLLIADLLRAAGAASSRAWCEDRRPPDSLDWYLRFRDALLRGR